MNQYHIFEAIGHGHHSVVYKGRRKKSIEYYAIKSVDKSQRSKVLQEVRILHSLNHENVLRFYSWYETSAHLWLILEYCVGGDLMSLLKQDRQLPEESVHDLARDLVEALQFLHSKGVIYCDLKPSNILLDENGRVKLCDFGLARRLSDISLNSLSELPQAKCGTPCYMAPELFQDGVHSYASDLWALGCVLYECYTGRPPFVANEFTQLVKSILYDPIPPLPGKPSDSFIDLINCLLIKDPAERVQWDELRRHSFWRRKVDPLILPPEPAFSNMINQLNTSSLSERNGDNPPSRKAVSKPLKRDTSGTHRHDENADGNAAGLVTSSRTTPRPNKVAMKVEKHKETLINTKGANVLRLSRIAKTNLLRENENDNYRRALPKESDVKEEVQIENNDMELDFGEHNEDDSRDEANATESPMFSTPIPKAKGSVNPQDAPNIVETNQDLPSSDTAVENNIVSSENGKDLDEASCSSATEATDTPPSANLQSRTPRTGIRPGGQVAAIDSDSSTSVGNLLQVLWHASDLSVRPVMPSKKSDKCSETKIVLPYDAPSASDFVKMRQEKLDLLTGQILACLTGSSVAEKQSSLRYLETLSGNADAANILINGPVMLLLVKMLKLSKVSSLRVQIVTLIGSLIRHSTLIETELANSGILGALADGLRDKQEKVRRFSMAALGELVFYISTQSDNNAKDAGFVSPAKDNRATPCWQVPGPIISLIASMLRKGEDDVTQLYALRTIENVCSQGSDWSGRFTSQEVIGNLCYVFKASGKQESTRLTAGSCLARLVRFSPPSIQSVVERLSFKDMLAGLLKDNPREQQISINLLNMALLGSQMCTNLGRHIISLAEDKSFVPLLISLIEQGSEVLRGKAFALAALLCKNGRRWLPLFCSAKLLSVVDRLAKEKDSYVQRCMDAFVQVVAGTVPGILESVANDIQQLQSVKRPGIPSRVHPKINIHLFTVILHLLGSFAFKNRVVNNELLEQVVVFLKILESSSFQGRDDFQITLLRILEAITQETSSVLEHSEFFTSRILTSLAALYKGNKDADARFLCFKILFDLMDILISDISDSVNSQHDQRWKDIKLFTKAHLLGLYPTLVEDEDPIPVYAQKLLVMLLDFNYIQVSDILHLKMISQCFEFLLNDCSNANVSNIKLCVALASASEMEIKMLSQLRVVKKIGNLLDYVGAKQMEEFLEPTLRLCQAFLLKGTGKMVTNKLKQLSLLSHDAADANDKLHDHPYINDISDFGYNIGSFLELSGNHVGCIADLASECIVLLLHVAVRETTTGLLTNTVSVINVLNCCQSLCQGSEYGVYRIVLLRILHALSVACQEYRSHAMILSLSATEILRIEAIVSELKKSTLPGIADSALEASYALQRLPHCR